MTTSLLTTDNIIIIIVIIVFGAVVVRVIRSHGESGSACRYKDMREKEGQDGSEK